MENKRKEENETNLNSKSKVKKRKVGRLTFGITLILLGISIFIQSIVSLDILKYVLMMWPLIFISLGIEVIHYSRKEEVDLKYDVWGIILIFIILVSATTFSVINYGVNKLLYSDSINEIVTREAEENTRTYTLSGKVTLVNLNDKKIDVKIIEDEKFDATKVTIRGKFNDSIADNSNMISLLNGNYSVGSIVDLDKFTENTSEQAEEEEEIESSSSKNKKKVEYTNFITINKFTKWIDSVEINIITNNKNNISTNGEFNIM